MKYSPIAQLTVARLREFIREPEAVFWVFGFPILMTILLGIAFREKPADKIVVDVQEGAFAEAAESILKGVDRFTVTSCFVSECRMRLRTNKTDLVVVSADGSDQAFDYLYDPTRNESVLAKKQVDDTLQRAQGRKDAFATQDREFKEAGGRYIDFLVPGL